ncbi:hypothetical protein [Ruminococcus sp. YE282]|uniref:hypothetical protein n=1 Tax=Ruminococcus sp. YE282 TaxID=3158780 RepID=UPI0008875764|nr:hypothetical protein SAMN02910441_01956 [Ruminococcus bromii]
MYRKLPNLVLGFHGCHRDVFKNVIYEGQSLKASSNSYDWLGNGIYFWEQNYERAFEWAKNRYDEHGAVIGAVIDLGYCLNLTDSSSAEVLRQGYKILKFRCDLLNIDLPVNRKSKKSKDVLLRDLDCAVIQQIHDFNTQNSMHSFDSVRGIFTEGLPVYQGSEFLEKTHVQLCICNPNCIKGYFNPLSKNDDYDLP